MDLVPVRIDVPAADMANLKARLCTTRWPEPATVDNRSQGVPLEYVQDLCRYWADGYDWPARQAGPNSFDQYRTELDGLPIHFLHVRSPQEDAVPLRARTAYVGAETVSVPTGVSLFPKEIYLPTRVWASARVLLLAKPGEQAFEDVAEGGELGLGQRVEQVTPDGLHMVRSGGDDGRPPGIGQPHHRSTGILGALLADEQPTRLHPADLVGEPAAFPTDHRPEIAGP